MSAELDESLLDIEEGPALKRLGQVVKARRELKGWSQQNLADYVRTSRDVIQRIECGKGAYADVVFRVLPVLDCTVRDLQRVLFGQKGANRVTQEDES